MQGRATPVRTNCARVVILAPPFIQPRPRVVPVTSFSLLDRARPVFFFSSGRKRENGGCKGPAIFMAESSPARRASTGPPPRGPLSNTPPCVMIGNHTERMTEHERDP